MSTVFSIQAGNNFDSRAKLAMYEYCKYFNISHEYSPKKVEDSIPIGTIEYCRGETWVPCFYNNLLSDYISRKIDYYNIYYGCVEIDLDKIEYPVFIKDGRTWKNDHFSKIFHSSEEVRKVLKPAKDCWLYFSEMVDFRQEWRYYVYRGNTIATGWYAGEDDDEPAPSLTFHPKVTGAIDVGRLSNGRMELVEMHAPFACGWYGDRSDNIKYGLWQHLAHLEEYGR